MSFSLRRLSAFFFSGISLIACAVFCNSSQASGAPTIKIELMSAAKIKGPIVALGDISVLTAKDKEIADRLAAMKLSAAPRIGYVDTVNRNQIDSRIREAFGFQALRVSWAGAERVFVRSLGESFDFSVIKKDALAYLETYLRAENRRVRVAAAGKAQKILLPYGNVSFKPRVNSSFISKRMCVWMDAYVDNTFYRAIPVWTDVEVWEPVYVAKHNISDKTTVTSDDFYTEQRDITDFSAGHFLVRDFDRPRLLVRGMSEGGVLMAANVTDVPAVIGGRKVDIVVREGRVNLRIQGVATSDAEIGDKVRVKTLHGDQLIKARVVGKQLVEVI